MLSYGVTEFCFMLEEGDVMKLVTQWCDVVFCFFVKLNQNAVLCFLMEWHKMWHNSLCDICIIFDLDFFFFFFGCIFFWSVPCLNDAKCDTKICVIFVSSLMVSLFLFFSNLFRSFLFFLFSFWVVVAAVVVFHFLCHNHVITFYSYQTHLGNIPIMHSILNVVNLSTFYF